MRRIACVFVVSLFAVVPAAVSQNQTAEEVFPKSGGASRMSSAQAFGAYGKLPLSFEANKGQSPSEAKFLARGLGYELFLTQKGAVLALLRPRQDGTEKQTPSGSNLIPPEAKDLLQLTQAHPGMPASIVSMEVIGANPESKIVGADELAGMSNYFVGNDPKKWRTNVPTFAKVKYQGIYPGVDLVYYGNQGRLECDFVVAPGADPQKIRLAATGAAADPVNDKGTHFLSIDTNGDLVVTIGPSEVRYQKPVVYQQTKRASSDSDRQESRQFVEARYVLKASNEVGFELGSYDPTQSLIIDPVLVYSTFLTGNYFDEANAIAVDSSGSGYVTGFTFSSVPTFPVTPGAYQTKCGTDAVCNYNLPNGGTTNTDAFVTKFTADGSGLVYSTYLGGSYDESGQAIAVDSSGSVYVTGYTRSFDFPTTTGAFQTTCAPYVVVSGTSCTVIPGSGCAGAPNAGRFAPINVVNVFVTKLNATGSGLVYSTFLGGWGNSDATGIALNAAGEVYIAGSTDAQQAQGFTDSGGCPAGYQTAHPTTTSGFFHAPLLADTPSGMGWPSRPGVNGFFSKLSADGSTLRYSTYLGSPCTLKGTTTTCMEPFVGQVANAVAVDASGAAYVTGSTNSPTFSVTSGAFQTVLNQGGGLPGGACGGGNCRDAFVAKFDPSLSGAASLVYSTFLGGSGADTGLAVAVDSANNAYVTGLAGFSAAASPDFPVNPGAFQSTCPAPCSGFDKIFVTKLNPTASALVYSSYLGGSSSDDTSTNSIALDSAGRAYITGSTNSTNFPNKNPVQSPPPPGATNAFVSVFKPDGSDLDFSTFLGGSALTFGQGIALDPSDNMYVTGYTLDQNFPTTTGAFQTTCAHCGLSGTNRAGFVTKISAVSATVTTATIMLSNLSDTYDGTPKAATATTNPPGLTGVSITYTGTGSTVYAVSTTPPTNAGTYSVDASLNNPNYQASDALGTLVISPVSASVTPNAASKIYGSADPAFTGTLSGFLPTDGVTATYSRTAGETVGSYAISASLTPAGVLSNYTVTYNTAALTITKAALTVTANNATRPFGAANPAFTGTIAGIRNGDNITATYSTPATPASPVGAYPIMPALVDPTNKLGNYTVASTNGTLTVTQASTTAALSTSPNPSTFGQSVTLTTIVSPVAPGAGTPTGIVTFRDGAATLGTAALNSTDTATLTTSSLAAGTHSLTASYGGDANFIASASSAVSEQVGCGLSIAVSPSTVARGGRITATGTLRSCATMTQTVVIKFTLTGPLAPNSCSATNSDMFTTPPFALAPNTLRTLSFSLQVPRGICIGTYSIVATTLVRTNGTLVPVSTSTASLTVAQ